MKLKAIILTVVSAFGFVAPLSLQGAMDEYLQKVEEKKLPIAIGTVGATALWTAMIIYTLSNKEKEDSFLKAIEKLYGQNGKFAFSMVTLGMIGGLSATGYGFRAELGGLKSKIPFLS